MSQHDPADPKPQADVHFFRRWDGRCRGGTYGNPSLEFIKKFQNVKPLRRPPPRDNRSKPQ